MGDISVKRGDAEDTQKLPELLAPAGSQDALKAAVGAGADAVYLGGKKFGARAYAENFDDTQLAAAIEYAHRADVRVYVTVNTLLAEHELAEAGKFLLFLYEQGVDGVLVQDPGLIRFARRRIPDLPLHGSTQLTLHNSAGVRWAADMGLKRVVLSREISASGIRSIADRLNGRDIGLEVFIHGALCYSYSGQCLLSSVIGGRSGNRGRCAQPCRKPYLLIQGSLDEYDRFISPQVLSSPIYCLSTRDLSTYLHLDELLRLPIDALKIEGRMKSPEYVATVVRIYRMAMDGIAAGAWTPRSEDIRDLLLAFNRGFTGGHLFGEPVMGASRPDHQGLLLGTVAGYDPVTHRIQIRLSGETVAEKGDGIHMIADGGEERGLCITRTPIRSGPFLYIPDTDPVQVGTHVFLTRRASLDQAAAQAIQQPRHHPIPATIQVSWDKRRAVFQGTIHEKEQDLSFRYESDLVWEEARTHPLLPEQIVQQLQKSGGTPFSLHVTLLQYPGGLFLPLSILNTLRRDLLSHMDCILLERYRPSAEKIAEARHQVESYHPAVMRSDRTVEPVLCVYVHTLAGVLAAIEGGADSICLDSGAADLSPVADVCRQNGISLIWIWPRIMHDAMLDEWLIHLEDVRGYDLAGIMVAGPGIAHVVQKRDPHIDLWGSVDLNVWNHCTVQTFSPLFRTLVVSPECSLAGIREITDVMSHDSPSLCFLVQGNLEVMVSENCPDERIPRSDKQTWGLRDIRDRTFPAILDKAGRTHIYNAVETCYIDYLHALKEAGIAIFVIEGRHRSSRYIREVTSLYREALRRTRIGDADCSDLKEEIKKRARGGITLGPLIKGLREEL
jgi:putative protease